MDQVLSEPLQATSSGDRAAVVAKREEQDT